MSGILRVSVALVLAPFLLAVMPAGAGVSASAPRIQARVLVERLADGTTVDEQGIVVEGDVDLRGIGSVSSPLRCLRCTFLGRLVAPDVIFERIVVLSGSRFAGMLDLRGAVFQDGLIARDAARAPTVFQGFSLFALATFADTAAFDEARFEDEANFVGARFLADASFAGATFDRIARFRQATFTDQAFFSSAPADPDAAGRPTPCATPVAGSFHDVVEFDRAVFMSSADFRHRCFGREAKFSSTTFRSRANFFLAQFAGRSTFVDAGFQGQALFVAARFRHAASFEQATAGGSISFEDVSFLAPPAFERMSVSGVLSFRSARFAAHLDAGGLIAGDLTMDVDDADRVAGADVRRRVLSLIEASARARGDLSEANDARFELLSLDNRRTPPPRRWVDGLLYRGIAGYLVRPAHPLVALLVFIAVAGLARGARRRRHERRQERRQGAGQQGAHAPPPWRAPLTTHGEGGATTAASGGMPLTVVKWLDAGFEGLGQTVRVAFRGKPSIQLGDREDVRSYLVAGARWVEYLTYKVLITLFLLGLANSNATLREIVDSVIA